MADVNRNEEKVPAPEEIHGLAAALDQFVEDFDPYEYMDTVEDKAQNIRDTEAMLLAGKTDGLKSYLLGFIDDGRDPQAVLAAQELMKRLEEIAPQNILRTAEMSMEQNCNMIDGILNNLQNPEEAGFSIDGGSRYLAIQTCDNGYDYTFFNQDFQELDGGQLDNPEFSMSRAIYELLSDERLQETKLEALDYAFLMEQAEAAEKEKRAAALAALAMQEQKQETPLLRVVPVNRFERYIEPSEITQDQYIVKGGILLTPCASSPDFYESSNRRVNGSYIDAHIYEVAERSKRGKPTAFRVLEDAPVENPFEPVGKEIAITQSGGIPCGLVYKHEMEGFILADKTVLLQKERDAHGKPVVLALNMMDIVEKRGMEIDTHRLPEMLGIPVIPVSARKRIGLDVLLHAAAHHKDCKDPECLIHHHKYKPKHRHDHHSEYAMVYSDAIEDKIDLIMAELKRKYPNLTNYRWHAIKLLEQDKEITERYPVSLPDVIDRNYESDIINEKYDFIQEIIKEVLVNKDRQDALTEKVDRALTHRIWGIPIFLGIMAVVFFLTFTIGDWLKGYFEMGIESLSALLSDGLVAAGVNEMLRSLLVDGIVAGVGGILTFLPNIFILFLALAFLEDSGYMARVAYVMEGIMSKLGLSGRAFIPMILGFGCTVPAIMASRALENRRDRFKVMLITPFMSCSARLPIYILFAEMFFQEHAMLVAYSMYLIGLLVAILVAAVIHMIDRRKSENYLLIELPEYKIPSSRTVAIYVWEKVKDYLTKAGTTIFVASILMWVILNFGPQGYTTEMADSFGAILGHFLVPFFAPIGLGFWQIAVALIAGISAKEVVVSSCAVLFGVPNINSGIGKEADALRSESIG